MNKQFQILTAMVLIMTMLNPFASQIAAQVLMLPNGNSGIGSTMFPASGNVGIGTVVPSARLDVVGTIKASSYISAAGNLNTQSSVWANQNIHANVDITADGNIKANNSLTVGQGTITLPTNAKISIFDGLKDVFTVYADGHAYAKEITVTHPNNFPDYVFASDYRLMPLQEVAAYIEANKHLPNIPSAAEVEEDGLSIGDMQVRQMEKIEELFLHMIESEKQMQAMQIELEKLKAKNALLEEELEALKAEK